MITPGAGGYGPPAERSQEDLVEDLTARHALQKTRQQDRWYAHNPILEAIKTGDADAAAAALRGHFDDVKGRLIAA